MSQTLAGQNDVNNDVVNNNQPEWNKILPRIGASGVENSVESANVYSGVSSNEKQCADRVHKSTSNQAESRFSNIQDGLEASISSEGRARVQGILNEVNRLSDVEKLLLYLKLPTGGATDDTLRQTPTSFLHSSNRIEQAQAFTWIRSHLEEDSEICVPKHEVYDDYRLYCESHNLKPLCPADFGKVMKCVFPNVKPRRLGQRGQSKYCYSGLRKKLEVQPPSLPELELTPRKEKEESNEEDEVHAASRQLVCEWAHKLLGANFSNLRELAEFLLGNLYVNSKSTAAFTVLAAMQDAGLGNSKVPVSSLFTSTSGGNKHKETQLQLQRKLQERELIKEQKRKLQQQRFENERENDLMRSQSVSPSVSPFPSPIQRSAARNITKMLQSPAAGEPGHSPHPGSQVGTGKGADGQADGNFSSGRQSANMQFSTMAGRQSETTHLSNGRQSANLHFSTVSGRQSANLQFATVSKPNDTSQFSTVSGRQSSNSQFSLASGRQSESAQFHVVKKPSVRQPNRTENDDTTDNRESQAIISEGSDGSDTSHFALPTTPSRSAFVPVSNQWKDHTGSTNSVDMSDEERDRLMDTDEAVSKPIQVETKTELKKSYSPPSHDNSINTSPSPQTPKKSRNRFTPIRPKVTPTKPTTIAQKDHKTMQADTPAYDSRPVSAILKEKRAREAQEILAQFRTSVQRHGGQLSRSSGVSPDILIPLPNGSKPNEVFIIVESPKPGSVKVDKPVPGLDMLGTSQFPPNVTVPHSQSLPLALLLARQEDSISQTRKTSSSLDNSDLSDYGNITDTEVQKSDESQDMIVSRDQDTLSGRKRKSSDREIESKVKRINSTDVRTDEDDVFLPLPDHSKTRSTTLRIRNGMTSENEIILESAKKGGNMSANSRNMIKTGHLSVGAFDVESAMKGSHVSFGQGKDTIVSSASFILSGEKVSHISSAGSSRNAAPNVTVGSFSFSSSNKGGQLSRPHLIESADNTIPSGALGSGGAAKSASVGGLGVGADVSHQLLSIENALKARHLSMEKAGHGSGGHLSGPLFVKSGNLTGSRSARGPISVPQSVSAGQGTNLIGHPSRAGGSFGVDKAAPLSSGALLVGGTERAINISNVGNTEKGLCVSTACTSVVSSGLVSGISSGLISGVSSACTSGVSSGSISCVSSACTSGVSSGSISGLSSCTTTTDNAQNTLHLPEKAARTSRGPLSVESLESDALLDNIPSAVDQNLVSSLLKPSTPTTQTASIGVNANSLTPTQKQLMQQKVQLDQRISNFFNKAQKKDVAALSQQMKLMEKSKMEHLVQQYIQEQKSEKKMEIKPQTKVANNQPVNLLSLLQQPVFDSKKVYLTSLSKSKPRDAKLQEPVVEPVTDLPQNSLDPFDLETSDLPSDVADFITENMIGVKRTPDAAIDTLKHLHEVHTFSMSAKVRDILQKEGGGNENKGVDKNSDGASGEQFTVPSTPPLPRQKQDSNNSKIKFLQVQRSSSFPVFAPPLSLVQGAGGTFMTLGKGLDMPAPPNRVIDSSSPQPIHQKASPPITFSSPGQKPLPRSRHTSIDRPNNHTPMSDAGYHSFDASPVMNSAPNIIASETLHHIPNMHKPLPRPDSAHSLTNEPSPLAQASPQAPSARSTPSSMVSPQLANQSSVNASPCENMTSPNSFMPIQGSFSSSCSPLSPQVVTPIKPQVTVAVSPATTVTSTTFSSSILLQLNKETKHNVPRVLHRSESQKDPKESSKTGVLQKLLNSTSLPSYEEAIIKLGQGDKDSTAKDPKTLNSTFMRSISQPANDVKNETSAGGSERGPPGKVISTSEYPFSYQLALLREKCLNPSGKENIKKDESDQKDQSVQPKPGVKSSDGKSPDADGFESDEGRYDISDSGACVLAGQGLHRANVTHHHYGAESAPSKSQAPHTRSKSSSSVNRQSSNQANSRTFTSNVPSSSSSSSSGSQAKQKQFPTTDLPNVNYMGNAPNIDLGSILQSKQSVETGGGVEAGGSGERRRMTLMQALQPTQTINEEELQCTLEILRRVDSEYFSQSDLDLDTMQPCAQPPAPQHLPHSSDSDSHDHWGSRRSKTSSNSLHSPR